jgi:DNA-binding CsgD family transcriptional regulator
MAEISRLLDCHASNYVRVGESGTGANHDRMAVMAALYREGKTLEYIGAQFGLTRERVRQIVRRAGVSASDGGYAMTSEARRRMAALRRDEASLQKYGCTHAQFLALRDLQKQAILFSRGPIGAFQRQRANAKVRSIEWRLTLWQWWTIWQESGKWEQRGRERGQFCMSRIGDAGAYEAGNVRIVTVTENISEGYATSPAEVRAKMRQRRDELGLTDRERDYFNLLQRGCGPNEIAAHLGVSAKTATHVTGLLRRRPQLRALLTHEVAA